MDFLDLIDCALRIVIILGHLLGVAAFFGYRYTDFAQLLTRRFL